MGGVEVVVIFFAKARELAGHSSQPLTLQSSTNLTQLKTQLVQAFPALEKLGGAFIVARNENYLEEDQTITLAQGDELAIIPPISGG